MRQFSIPAIPDALVILDTALSRGAKRASGVKKRGDATMKAKESELSRLSTVQDSLTNALSGVHDAFPSFDQLSDFLLHLYALEFEVGRTKQALGGLQHAIRTVKGIAREQGALVRAAKTPGAASQAGRAALGRIASVIRPTQKHLDVLKQARVALLNLPKIDDELFTVAIAGFPNVGKSTLLAKLTAAKPEIKAYAFTTKGLNVGYFEHRYNRIQCVDTPGTLARENANPIERKAEIALKYLAHLVVFVVDPTGSYPLKKQRLLYERTEELGKPMLVYVSKTDIADEKVVADLLATYPGAFTDAETLRSAIKKQFRTW